MTVAPSRSNTLPHDHTALQALKSCLQTVRQTGDARIASLAFSLPEVDPLSVLLTVADSQQRQCYLESPTKGPAIAAWDDLLSQQFSGQERFLAARQYLATWQKRVIAVTSPLKEGPYFFCSFSFFDTVANPAEGFAPATVLLTRWQVVRHQRQCRLIANVLIEAHTAIAPIAREIAQQLRRIRSLTSTYLTPSPYLWSSRFRPQLSTQDAQILQQKVRETLGLIQTGQLQKQVVAHALDVQRERPFHRSVALPRLRSRHPDCYIFSLSGTTPNTHFIGASPERLLSIRQGRLVTDALAGSAPRGATPTEDDAIGQRLLNTPKEQREHQLVLDFILQQLRRQGLSPRYSTRPGLLRLSHIQHLHTPIYTDLPVNGSPLALVEALHPTPAVAGVPADTACRLIHQGESTDRGLYAAPLGWTDPHGNSEFVVGIRSALVQGDRARLYAGAGIVAGSNPAKELAEIQLKLQALAEALG